MDMWFLFLGGGGVATALRPQFPIFEAMNSYIDRVGELDNTNVQWTGTLLGTTRQRDREGAMSMHNV